MAPPRSMRRRSPSVIVRFRRPSASTSSSTPRAVRSRRASAARISAFSSIRRSSTLFIKSASRNTNPTLSLTYVLRDYSPRSDDSVIADFHAREDYRASPDQHPAPDADSPSQHRARCEMSPVADHAIVIDNYAMIYDNSPAHGCTRRNDRPRRDKCPVTKLGVNRHFGSRVHNRYKERSERRQSCRDVLANAVLAYRNMHEGGGCRGGHRRVDNRPPQQHLHLTLVVPHLDLRVAIRPKPGIENDFGVPAGPYHQRPHVSTRSVCEAASDRAAAWRDDRRSDAQLGHRHRH